MEVSQDDDCLEHSEALTVHYSITVDIIMKC